VFETRGWHYSQRSTANPGCKHVGSGSVGPDATTVRLVDIWSAWEEETIFTPLYGSPCDGFEVHQMVLDCNAANLPKYNQGEQIWIRVPLVTTGVVNTVTLKWANKTVPGISPPLKIGRGTNFNLCTVRSINNTFVTNCATFNGTSQTSVLNVNAAAEELVIQLNRRAAGIEFYSLSEIEISGGTTGVPSAKTPGGAESRLDSDHSIVQVADGSLTTSWASGSESQAQIEFPLRRGTQVSQVNLYWNCKLMTGVGRLGPAANYLIRAWDDTDGQYHDVPFVRHPMGEGVESATFGTALLTNSVTTTRLMILLTARDLGVNFYSLREISLQNNMDAVSILLPTAKNSLPFGNFSILRAFDGDNTTEWGSGTQGMVGAISVSGNNLKFTHLKVIGFGTKAGREGFPMFICPNRPAEIVRIGNIIVEDCVISNPATSNTDGISALNMNGNDRVIVTNAVVRRCTISGLRPYFSYSHGYAAARVENSVVMNCGEAIYYEPDSNPAAGNDHPGSVLLSSNLFLDVDSGINISTHPGASFESITCLRNEIVLSGRTTGWGFGICDTCYVGPTSTTTNVTMLRNIIRYADWAPRPSSLDIGFYYSNIQHALFGGNIVALGSSGSLRVRSCPSGLIPSTDSVEDCDHLVVIPPPPPTYPICLDALRPGYQRAWFDNRDLSGVLLPVRFSNNNVDGMSAQQQIPE
jgi:hypothetical protein